MKTLSIYLSKYANIFAHTSEVSKINILILRSKKKADEVISQRTDDISDSSSQGVLF